MGRKELEPIAKSLEVDVRARTRDGFGVDAPERNKRKLKPLSASYKRKRRNIVLDGTTSPSKSNLTQKGEMLTSLKGTATNDTITVEASGNKQKRKVKLNADKNRKFLNISKSETRKVVRELFDAVSKKINDILG